MIVPVLTSLDTVTAADAFGRIEENASCFAVPEPRGWNDAAVLFDKTLVRGFHVFAQAPMYHFFFAAVNYRVSRTKAQQTIKGFERTRVEKKRDESEAKNATDSTWCSAVLARTLAKPNRSTEFRDYRLSTNLNIITAANGSRGIARQRFISFREIGTGLARRRHILSSGSLQDVFSAAGPFRIVTMNRN